MEQYLDKATPFTLISHSFGTLVALELLADLEKDGYSAELFLIDGAPHLLQQLTATHLPIHSETEMGIALLFRLLMHIYPLKTLLPYKVMFNKLGCVNQPLNWGAASSRIQSRYEKTTNHIIFLNRCKGCLNLTKCFWRNSNYPAFCKQIVKVLFSLGAKVYKNYFLHKLSILGFDRGNPNRLKVVFRINLASV